MHLAKLAGALAGATLVLGAGSAMADTMHPQLAARLSGMGEHGIVNLQSQAAKGRLCWTFDLGTKGITGASVRDAHGMVVAKLGSGFAKKGCTPVKANVLATLESAPAKYLVWVDTKGHPGDLRGKLFAGMAHM